MTQKIKIQNHTLKQIPQTHTIVGTLFTLNWVHPQTKSYKKLIP
jgi:hypothetical protein